MKTAKKMKPCTADLVTLQEDRCYSHVVATDDCCLRRLKFPYLQPTLAQKLVAPALYRSVFSAQQTLSSWTAVKGRRRRRCRQQFCRPKSRDQESQLPRQPQSPPKSRRCLFTHFKTCEILMLSFNLSHSLIL